VAVTASNACTAREPCEGDNVLYGGKCYKRLACGGKDQRACTLGERFPSCKPEYYEAGGKCLPIPPGENAWSASLKAVSAEVGDAHDSCRTFWIGLAKGGGGSPAARDTIRCMAHLDAGYYCAPVVMAQDTLDTVTSLVRLPETMKEEGKHWERRFSDALEEDPCRTMHIPVVGDFRPECAVAKALYDEAHGAIACLTQAEEKGFLEDLIPGLEGACELAGEAIFNLEVDLVGGEVLEAAKAAQAGSKLAKLVVKLQKVASRVKKGATVAASFEQKLRTIQACRELDR